MKISKEMRFSLIAHVILIVFAIVSLPATHAPVTQVLWVESLPMVAKHPPRHRVKARHNLKSHKRLIPKTTQRHQMHSHHTFRVKRNNHSMVQKVKVKKVTAMSTRRQHKKHTMVRVKQHSLRHRDHVRRAHKKQQMQRALAASMAEAVQAESRAFAMAEQRAQVLVQYQQRIKQAIEAHWSIPVGTQTGTWCRIHLVLDHSGHVIQIRLVHASGFTDFDQSALLAVQSADPLPVPHDPFFFKGIRQLNITLKPE